MVICDHINVLTILSLLPAMRGWSPLSCKITSGALLSNTHTHIHTHTRTQVALSLHTVRVRGQEKTKRNESTKTGQTLELTHSVLKHLKRIST